MMFAPGRPTERMATAATDRPGLPERRHGLGLLATLPWLALEQTAAAAGDPARVAALQVARAAENSVHHDAAFGRRAQQDGHRGIACLFAAFAASEAVHAANFGKVRVSLHVDLWPLAPPAVRVDDDAWSSEQQQRDKIQQIQRWSGTFFETVARTIDEKTGRYFACLNCGATVDAVPADQGTVFQRPPTNCRGVEPPA